MFTVLLKLMLVRAWASVRRLFIGSTKRTIISVLGLGLLGLSLAPMLLLPFFRGYSGARAAVPGLSDTVVAAGALAWILLPTFSFQRGGLLAFTPAEVDQLLPAPFSTRQLIAAKLVWFSAMAAITGVWLALILQIHLGPFHRAAPAVALTATVVVAWNVVLKLLRDGPAWQRVLRVAIAVVPAAMLALAALDALRPLPDSLASFAQRAGDSPTGAALLAAAQPFVDVLRADEPWAALAVVAGVLVVLWAVALRVGPGAIEAIVEHAARRQRVADQVMARGFAIDNTAVAARRTLPTLPRLAGAGPLVWRQLLSVYRGSGMRAVLMLVVFIGVAGFMLSTSRASAGAGVGFLIAFAVGVLPSLFRVDFRGDLDIMEPLKALPLSPIVIAAGQIACTALLSATLLSLTIIVLGVITRADPLLVGAGVLAIFPMGVVIACVENAAFLLYPVRLRAAVGGSPQMVSRGIILLLVRGLFLAPIVLGGAGVGWMLFELTGSWTFVALGVACVTWLGAFAGVRLVAWAFERFDVSADIPG